MTTLEELKQKWDEQHKAGHSRRVLDHDTMIGIIRSRIAKNTSAAMKYFWGSFVLQIIIYALLSHLIVKYWHDAQTLWLSVGGILLYVPFTILLLTKIKRIAKMKLTDKNDQSVQQYLSKHRELLLDLYQFKRRFDFLLVPLSSAIGIMLTFELWVPGGVTAYPGVAAVLFVVTIGSCLLAIRSENRNSFEKPLEAYREILNEFQMTGQVLSG